MSEHFDHLAMETLRRVGPAACVLMGPDQRGRWTCQIPRDHDAQGQAIGGFVEGVATDPADAIMSAARQL